jgi:hypothetical protein
MSLDWGWSLAKKILVSDDPHYKPISISYPSSRELFKEFLVSTSFLQICYDFVVKLYMKLMTNFLQAHSKSD